LKSFYEVALLLYYNTKINNFFSNKDIVACYIYHDTLGGVFSLFNKKCVEKGIKLVAPPCAYQNPQIPAFRRSKIYYLNYYNKGGLILNKWIKDKFPNQFYVFEKHCLLFYNPYEIIAWSILNMLPKKPWVVGANYCDFTCVEDYYIKKLRIESGVQDYKLKVISHVDTDLIWQSKLAGINMLSSKGHINSDMKYIVYSVPQLFQEGYMSDWNEFIEHLKLIVSLLCKTNQNVLLVLHPKMNIKDYKILETLFNCKIYAGPTAQVVAMADFYISAGSSTNYWALLSGAIVIDTNKFYENSPNYYDYLDSVFEVNNTLSLTKTLYRLINDSEYYSSIQQKVFSDQKKWLPVFDGKAGNKIVALIDS
jgi:hypothetical protein